MTLPFSRLNPIIYDNDSHSDTYADEYLLALASAGEIDLRGLITSSPANLYVNRDTYELDAAGRDGILAKARRSGMRNVPSHVHGPSMVFAPPSSGQIEDTVPIDTPGSRLIVTEAQRTEPNRPLVVIMGGPLTVVADAYLLEPSIANKLIVAWLGGTHDNMFDYNGWVDPWADYIVLQRLNLVQCPSGQAEPRVPKSGLAALPDTELRQWMIDKQLPHVKQPGNTCADSPQIVAVMRPDYVLKTRQVVFDHWDQVEGHSIPAFRDDPEGRSLVVIQADPEVATEAWWQALQNPKAWVNNAVLGLPDAKRSFYAAPFPIGKISRIEVEDFDRGSEGVAYHLSAARTSLSNYRPEAVEIVPAEDVPGGYNIGADGGFCVKGLLAGEWLAYTIHVEIAGRYPLAIRVASRGGGLHVEVDGEDLTGELTAPDTGEGLAWQTLPAPSVTLRRGEQVLRLVMDHNGVDSTAGSFNYILFGEREKE
jgi:hypothetical protein